MKKIFLILPSVWLILTSCSKTQFSSEENYNSTNISSSTASVSESSIVSLIANGAYKYDGGLSSNALVSKAGVSSTNGKLIAVF